MKNIYYQKIINAFEPCNGMTYQEIFEKCGINKYSAIAHNRFRYAWNDLEASGRIELVSTDQNHFTYYLHQ